MGILEGIILGIVQGLTEFLPVSSSGHLVIIQEFLGVRQAGITFEVMVHFGTLLSVIWIFGKDIVRLLAHFTRRQQERHFVLMLVLGVIPTGLMGIFLGDWFERFFESTLMTGVMLLLTGLILFTLAKLKPGKKNEKTMTPIDAIIISIAQGIAIIPGISRSGSTITSALWRGLDRETAVRFSFLISIPVILGVSLLEFKNAAAAGFSGISTAMIIGTVTAFAAGIFAIRLFIRFVQSGKFHYFAYYCWFAGGLTILLTILR